MAKSQKQLPGSGDFIDAEIVNVTTHPVNRHHDGFVQDIAIGMKGVFWSIRHPWKTFKYGFGAFCGLCGAVALVGGVAHLIAGEPGSAQLNGFDPLSAGKVSADMIRPVVFWGAETVDAGLSQQTTLVDTPTSETPADAVNYRR